MELMNIDVIGAQVAQRGFQILSEFPAVFGSGFACDKNLAADSLQRLPQLNLAVGIGPGGVEISNSALIGPADQAHSLLLRNALNRKRTEPVLVNGNSCFPNVTLSIFFPPVYHTAPRIFHVSWRGGQATALASSQNFTSRSSVPPVKRASPAAARRLSRSFRTTPEKATVTRMLSLSMGTTTLAGPSCSAR